MMAVWLIRAGSHGEYEQKFLQEKRVYCTWHKLNVDLSRLPDREALFHRLSDIWPEAKSKTIHNWVSQVWPFAHSVNQGDLAVLPLKTQPAIYFGEITSDYHFEPKSPDPFYHWRSPKWIGEAIPRSHFGQDLLYSFGAFMTICRITRNNAEGRIASMRANGWKPETKRAVIKDIAVDSEDVIENSNLEELAEDQIARMIEARFKGNELTRLVDAVLRAQGYATYLSPAGPDGGVDILAGAPPLGFGAPRLCVEVKSETTPIDRPTVDKLLGAMTKFGAQEGLFVAWGGFKSNVQKELAGSFFRLRLWSRKDLLAQIFTHYDKLDDDIKAELVLKRIWSVATQEEE
jgi:restriction system protein